MHDLNYFLETFVSTITTMKLLDLADIAIVGFLFYKILYFIKDTRAEQLMKGIFLLIVITQASSTFKLHALHWILVNSLQFGLLALLIIFQSELRAGLERLGRTNFKFSKSNIYKNQEHAYSSINELVDSMFELSKTKTGALVVIEKETKLTDIMRTGTEMDALLSKELLINIFSPNTPLHDGAVIIRDFRISASGCFLPLTQRKDINKQLGTRHRAGIGISETSDSLTIMVSEETGYVSIAQNGKFTRNLSKEDCIQMLMNELMVPREEKSFLRSVLSKWFQLIN